MWNNSILRHIIIQQDYMVIFIWPHCLILEKAWRATHRGPEGYLVPAGTTLVTPGLNN